MTCTGQLRESLVQDYHLNFHLLFSKSLKMLCARMTRLPPCSYKPSSLRMISVYLATILSNRQDLRWIYRGSAYCQQIRHANKEKRQTWARSFLHDSFDNVIWSDETTVQLETHRCFCYRKEGEKPRPKYRPKHLHVWAGISKQGATQVCIFEGIMAAPLYCEILQRTLLSFI